jgi:predicted MPP superfamily phosphohydrolase
MKISIPVMLLLLTIISGCTQISSTSTTSSFVHILDTQNLASTSTTSSFVHISDTQGLAFRYPETYDYTFSYLDSIKERYNISAIIITGDLVDTWNKTKEWDAYSHAVHQTSIPVYVIAGNHDTNNGKDYHYYTLYTGNSKNSYVTSIENFDLVGINFADDRKEFASLRKTLVNSPKNLTIIATHDYMDKNGILFPIGNDISQQLIVKPTIILAGHIHGAFVRDRMIGPYPVIEDLTNYQDGIPGGSASTNVSAGTFYTITTRNGQVEKISAKIIWISPR